MVITNLSTTVPVGEPVTLMNATVQPIYMRIINVGTIGGGVAWLSRVGTPAPNAPGSYPLAPYGNGLGIPSVEEFNQLSEPGRSYLAVPGGTLMAVSDGGTSGTAAAPLTIEII